METPDYPPPHPPYELIASLMKEGKVVLFLGPGASVAARGPHDPYAPEPWTTPEFNRLPSRDEVARRLTTQIHSITHGRAGEGEEQSEGIDLALAAQLLEMLTGRYEVDRALREAYQREPDPEALHGYLARFPANLLIVTTNYDRLLERAFIQAGRPFDLLTYHRERPAFLLREGSAGGARWVLPNEVALDLSANTVIYKMHGTVDSQDPGLGGCVVTEEDYVDFLARMGARTAIPAALAEAFRKRHFLFIGYNLRDWYSRVILQMLWRDWPLRFASWAVERIVTPLEREFYERHGLHLYQADIEEFAQKLWARL